MDEHIYLKIPSEYVCIFNKLMIYLADLGKELIDDCSTSCKNRNKLIIDCWNVFQLAVINKLNGKDKLAKYFIDYIENQLKNLSNALDLGLDVDIIYKPIDDKGYLKSTLNCKKKDEFIVNSKDGWLYKITNSNNDDKFYIENDNLIVDYNKSNYERVYTEPR